MEKENLKKKKIIRRKTQFNIDLGQDDDTSISKKTKISLDKDLSVEADPATLLTKQKVLIEENKIDNEPSIKKRFVKMNIIFILIKLITLIFFIIIIVNNFLDIFRYSK